jgi:hypothetical protein
MAQTTLKVSDVLTLLGQRCLGTYQLGVKYGYARGYESGHEVGVNKALRISQDDLEEMQKRRVEMENDENLIKKMDEI